MSAGASRLCVLGAALLFSTGGAAIKATSLGGWSVACLRSGLAALFLGLCLPAARRSIHRGTWPVALAYATTLILFVLANKRTTASNAIFLQSTAPLYVLVLAPWWLKERIRARDLVFMAALAVGMACIFASREAARETATDPWVGNLLGAAAAITWAFTVTGIRALARTEGDTPLRAALGATLVGNALVFVLALPWALAAGGAAFGAVTAGDLLWLGWLGIFQIGLAYVLLTRGMRGVPAFEASLLLLVEPVLSTGWAWGLHGEVPGRWALVGAGTILVATAWHALARRGGQR